MAAPLPDATPRRSGLFPGRHPALTAHIPAPGMACVEMDAVPSFSPVPESVHE